MMRIILSKALAIALLVTLIPLHSQEQPLPTTKQVSMAIQQEINCLSETIYYEAGNESYEGKLAVAAVVINRTKSKLFPSSICSVVYQKTGNIYQFSWVGTKKYVKNIYSWEESQMVAKKAFTESNIHHTIQKSNALFYHNTSVDPKWKLKFIVKIGNHLFYSKT
jgi:spore germination cell wall hydrolase CwlJ-like protein